MVADESYLARLGWKFKKPGGVSHEGAITHIRQAILDGLVASNQGEISTKGPRGGLRWTPRFFVRRVIGHVLDHAWEIEDRID
jgi:hypothetical protein